MRGVNKAIIIGNVGGDPDVRQFKNGSVATISVATSEVWNDKNTGERRETTEWHRVKFFNKLAEIASQYLKKGAVVYLVYDALNEQRIPTTDHKQCLTNAKTLIERIHAYH